MRKRRRHWAAVACLLLLLLASAVATARLQTRRVRVVAVLADENKIIAHLVDAPKGDLINTLPFERWGFGSGQLLRVEREQGRWVARRAGEYRKLGVLIVYRIRKPNVSPAK